MLSSANGTNDRFVIQLSGEAFPTGYHGVEAAILNLVDGGWSLTLREWIEAKGSVSAVFPAFPVRITCNIYRPEEKVTLLVTGA